MQDICFDNMLYGLPLDATIDPRIVEGKLYIIDFHTSRQFALEPGHQPPIALPPSQVEKPPGVTTLDPYAFDVYASGMLMQQILKVGATHNSFFTVLMLPRSLHASRNMIFLGSLSGMRSGWLATSAGAHLYAIVVRQPEGPVSC